MALPIVCGEASSAFSWSYALQKRGQLSWIVKIVKPRVNSNLGRMKEIRGEFVCRYGFAELAGKVDQGLRSLLPKIGERPAK